MNANQRKWGAAIAGEGRVCVGYSGIGGDGYGVGGAGLADFGL
jgi:hypothetical protein